MTSEQTILALIQTFFYGTYLTYFIGHRCQLITFLHDAVDTFPPLSLVCCQKQVIWVAPLSATHSALQQINPSYSVTMLLITDCAMMWSQQIQQEDESCLQKSLLHMSLNF